jgi:hypothetical protein
MKYSTKLPVFALFLSILAFTSCQKDVAINNEAEQFTTAKTPDLVYMADYESYQVPADNAKAKINQVAEALRANNLQLRSGTTLPVAEAIWDIEALSNATQAQANWDYKKLTVVKSYIPLTTTTEGGQKRVAMQEVSDKYASAVASIQQAGANTGYPSAKRQTIYADVVPFQDANGNVILELNTGIGLDPVGCPSCPLGGGLDTEPMSCSTTDCWRTAFKLGTCNTPTSGPGQGTYDASDIIQNLIMNNAAPPDISSCLPAMSQVMPPTGNGPGYFIGIIMIPNIFKPLQNQNPNFQAGMPEVSRYLLFRSNESSPGGYVTCLPPSHIDFFRDGAVKIIVDSHNANLGGKWTDRYFVDCNVYYDFLTNGTQNMEHHLTIRVGTYVQ